MARNLTAPTLHLFLPWILGGTAIYKLYRYVPLWRVWFSGRIVWDRNTLHPKEDPHIYAIWVCAAVEGMVFRQYSLG